MLNRKSQVAELCPIFNPTRSDFLQLCSLINLDRNMSQRVAKSPKLELKLNLSPPRENPPVESPDVSTTSPASSSSSEMSIEGSCVSSEAEDQTVKKWPRNSEATSMMLVGCPRCLMYVMLSEVDPKCPKCKSTVLLDFLKDEKNRAKNNTSN